MRFKQVVVLASVAAAMACGGGSPTGNNNPPPPPPPPSPGVHDVTIKDFLFSPQSVTIKVGESVRWTNTGPSVHHVVSDAGLWDSQDMLPPGTTTDPYGNSSSTPGASYSFTFTQPGTYTYHCANHPPSGYPNFVGTIIVQ